MPDMSLRPGDVFAGYTIERELGSGGMGAVYLAHHPRLPRMDALKLLRPELCSDTNFVTRFEREADMVARLDHPNIVSVHDRGSQDGQLWISMRFIDGTNAEQALREEPAGMPPERVVRIIGKVASALDYAHRHGLLHRDVKPANILLTPGSDDEDESERVFLSDFGVAKAIGEASESMSALTSTGSVVATLDYASPEQIKGQPLDHRSDIYALGCVLYKLLTGDVPYPAESVVARVYGHLNKEIPRPTAAVPSLPSGFDDVVAMAMAKERDDRYQTCRAMGVAGRAALTTAPSPPGAAEASDDGLPTTAYLLPGVAPRAHPGSPSAPGRDTTSAATQANPAPSESSADGSATVAAAQHPDAGPSASSPGPDASWVQDPQAADSAAPNRRPYGSGADDPRAHGSPAQWNAAQPWPEASRGDAPPAQPAGPRGTLEQPSFAGPPPGGGYDGARGPAGPPPGPTGPRSDPSPGSPRRWPLITAIVAAVLVAAAVGTWFVLRDGTSSTAPPGTGTSTAASGPASGSPSESPSASSSSPSPSSASASSSSVVGTPPAGPVAGLPHATPLPEQVLIGSRVVDDSSNMYLYNGSTGEIDQQLTSGSPGAQYPVLSPDRGSVIYLQTTPNGPSTLRTMAVDGSGDRQLFDLPADCIKPTRPAWNPLVPTEIALACGNAEGEVSVHRWTVTGEDVAPIITGLTVADDFTYSRDGSTLAFWGADAVGSQSAIFVQPADGSSPARKVTQPPAGASDADPVFSPDGRTIVFRRREGDGPSNDTRQLFAIGIDGTNLRPLTDAGGFDQNPSYSPDGTQVVFDSNRQADGGKGRTQLWVVNANGTGLTPLAADAPGSANSAPAWSSR